MAYELVGYVNRQTFATFTPGKQNGVIEMSEYENQLQRMRDAFAASIVKSMTPEEINNTFQKLHDENQTLKLRAEKAERELDNIAVVIGQLIKRGEIKPLLIGDEEVNATMNKFAIQQKVEILEHLLDVYETEIDCNECVDSASIYEVINQPRAQLKGGE